MSGGDAIAPPTLAQAFSIRRNLRSLFHPKGHRLAPLDGLRAIAILWVMLFHAGWYARFSIAPGAWFPLVTARWMLPFWRGDFGVDLFFVLSGFLIAGILLDEHRAHGKLALGLFYIRRLLRLWPALLTVIVADSLTDDPHKGLLWLNALYLNNFISVWFSALGWTWSLAIEEQFYLLCPWLLRAIMPLSTRKKVAVLAALMAALVGIAVRVVLTYGLRPWDAEILGQLDYVRWGLAFDVFYDKLWMRAGALVAGVTAAVLFRSPAAMSAITHARVRVTLGLVGALLAMALSTHWPLSLGHGRVGEVLYLSTFRTVFGVSAAFVTLVALSEHSVGRALGRILGARWLFPISQLSYCAYLVNPTVTLFVDDQLRDLPHGQSMKVLMPCNVLATLATALVLHLAVERPFMELRPRAPMPLGSDGGA